MSSCRFNGLVAIMLAWALCGTTAIAGPIHRHCRIDTWDHSEHTVSIGINPFDATNHNVMVSPVQVSGESPQNATEDCPYEISDITSVTLKFFKLPAFQIDSLDISVSSSSDPLGTSYAASLPSVIDISDSTSSGQSYTFTWPPHPEDGAINTAPNPKVDIFFRVTSALTIPDGANVNVTIDGHHYYIPEPSVAVLFGIGVSGIFYRLSNRKRLSV